MEPERLAQVMLWYSIVDIGSSLVSTRQSDSIQKSVSLTSLRLHAFSTCDMLEV